MNDYTTTSFPAGSEFRITWNTWEKNPRFIPGSRSPRTRHWEITTKHTSPVFDTYEAAVEFAVENDVHPAVDVRTPGNKNFISSHTARKA